MSKPFIEIILVPGEPAEGQQPRETVFEWSIVTFEGKKLTIKLDFKAPE